MLMTSNTNVSKAATYQPRISELDLLRGFALCGILFLNIISMGYLIEAYSNPYAFKISDIASANNVNWFDGQSVNNFFFIFTHLFIDQKMMGLFSLLFGASSMLFLSNLKTKKQSAAYYFKRNLWLLLFGLLHGIFIFSADILFIYSLCGLGLFFFSKMRPSFQFVAGLSIYSIPIYHQFNLQTLVNNFSIEQTQELIELWEPSLETIQASIEFERTANYLERIFTPFLWDGYNDTFSLYANALMLEGFARSFGLMLIGMSFITLGILPNHGKCQPITFYKKVFVFCFLIGFTTICLGLWLNFSYNWQANYSAFGGRLLNHIGSPFLSFAYLALIMVWSNKKSTFPLLEKLKTGLIAVGRMALTNYIMQSIFGLILFTSIGFSLFGQLNRLELTSLVLIICLFQLYFSIFWLRYFKHGPLEWLWRSLTFTKFLENR